MRYLICLLLINYTHSVVGQNCSSLVRTIEDKVTGRTSRQSIAPIVLKKSRDIGLIMMFSDGLISLQVVDKDMCIDKETTIYVLFKDGSRLQLSANNDFNCDGDVVVYHGDVFGLADQVNQLKTKPIDVMRIMKYKGSSEFIFSSDQAKKFMATLSCF